MAYVVQIAHVMLCYSLHLNHIGSVCFNNRLRVVAARAMSPTGYPLRHIHIPGSRFASLLGFLVLKMGMSRRYSHCLNYYGTIIDTLIDTTQYLRGIHTLRIKDVGRPHLAWRKSSHMTSCESVRTPTQTIPWRRSIYFGVITVYEGPAEFYHQHGI